MASLLTTASVGRVARAVLLVLAAQACTSDAPESDAPLSGAGDAASAEAEIRATGARVVAAWNAEDPAAVASYYTSDAIVTADSTYRGRDEIRDRWVAPMLPRLADLAVRDVVVTETGEGYTATGRYSYVLTLPDSSPVQVNGTYRNTWRQENGTWLIASSGLEIDGPEAAR